MPTQPPCHTFRTGKPKADKTTQQRYDRSRPSSGQRGYNSYWRKLRQRVLNDQPLCEHCLKENRITSATEVDHIIPLRHGGTNDISNLQALCKPCHSRKTARENKAHKNRTGGTPSPHPSRI